MPTTAARSGGSRLQATQLRDLEQRLRKLEDTALLDTRLHSALDQADGRTASAVDALALAINHPREGLIVELAKFQAEVRADRATFRAWIAGATTVIGVIFTLVTAFAPFLQRIVSGLFGDG